MTKKILNKRGVELTLNTIVIAIIILIVMVIMIFIFRSLLGKGKEQTEAQLDIVDIKANDADGDGIHNLFDECPCDPTNTCKENLKEGEKIDKSCLENK